MPPETTTLKPRAGFKRNRDQPPLLARYSYHRKHTGTARPPCNCKRPAEMARGEYRPSNRGCKSKVTSLQPCFCFRLPPQKKLGEWIPKRRICVVDFCISRSKSTALIILEIPMLEKSGMYVFHTSVTGRWKIPTSIWRNDHRNPEKKYIADGMITDEC